MARIEARQLFRAPPEFVWKVMTTPETVLELGLAQSVRRIDGVDGGCWDEGARREILISGWRFVELVKNVHVGESMEIEVLENTSPIRQDYERVEWKRTADGCEVIWTIDFTMKRPWLRPLDPVIAAISSVAYQRILKKLKTRIETHNA